MKIADDRQHWIEVSYESTYIFVTTKDAGKLIRKGYHSDYRGSDYLKNLAEEIEKASVVQSNQIPSDVITFNFHSTARLVGQNTASCSLSLDLSIPD